AGSISTPTATPQPTATPTADVTFQVAVTAIPARKHHRALPTPRPTRFVVPKSAYIRLEPTSGPPLDRTVTVVGGNLPHEVAVDVVWSPNGRVTPLATTGYTDAHGALRATLSIPASAPGTYRVVATVQGVRYAVTTYRIASAATLTASVVGASDSQKIVIVGKKFIPRYSLTLIAYSTVGGRKPIVLGTVQANDRGRFTFTDSTTRLDPGQYLLRAWSLSAVAAQMAQTFFEVVV
ncbi:MAG TPA: hypothetical protein VF221_03945, partial [Chloroflexota bacterium]